MAPRRNSGSSLSGKLRRDLLSDYDAGTFPWESVWEKSPANTSDASVNTTEPVMKGLPVEVGINYHRVFSVDVTKSIADLVVWFRVS
eukprot:3545638-Ditylum_brightwellii.AAC.2